MQRLKYKDLLNNRDNSHMIKIAVLARPVVDLNLSGKQIAYQRSTDMKVSVRTDTVTDTDCKHNKNIYSFLDTKVNILPSVFY